MPITQRNAKIIVGSQNDLKYLRKRFGRSDESHFVCKLLVGNTSAAQNSIFLAAQERKRRRFAAGSIDMSGLPDLYTREGAGDLRSPSRASAATVGSGA